MPIPLFVGKINRDIVNRLISRLAGRVPPFAIIIHCGRRSGRVYHTPIMVFPCDDGFDIALTYGPETDWVRNVLNAGGCSLEYRGQHFELTAPEHFASLPESASFPILIRSGLRLLRVHDYLRLYRIEQVDERHQPVPADCDPEQRIVE